MSGTSKLVLSQSTMKNASQSALTKALENANEVAAAASKEPKAKNESKKK